MELPDEWYKPLDINGIDLSKEFPHGRYIVNSNTLAVLLQHASEPDVHVSVLNLGSLRLERRQVIANVSHLVHPVIDRIKLCLLDGSIVIENPGHQGK